MTDNLSGMHGPIVSLTLNSEGNLTNEDVNRFVALTTNDTVDYYDSTDDEIAGVLLEVVEDRVSVAQKGVIDVCINESLSLFDEVVPDASTDTAEAGKVREATTNDAFAYGVVWATDVPAGTDAHMVTIYLDKKKLA